MAMSHYVRLSSEAEVSKQMKKSRSKDGMRSALNPSIAVIHRAYEHKRVKYRLSVFGHPGVGKSSLIMRLLNPDDVDFLTCELPESGVEDTHSIVLQVGGKANPKLFDTDETPGRGQQRGERVDTLEEIVELSMVSTASTTPTGIFPQTSTVLLEVEDTGQGSLEHSRQVAMHGAISVFDLTDAKTFSYLQLFPYGFMKKFQGLSKESIPYAYKTFALVGNKADLLQENATDSDQKKKKKRGVFVETAQLFCEEHEWLYYEVSALTGQNCEALFDAMIRNIDAKLADGVDDDPSKKKSSCCCCVVL